MGFITYLILNIFGKFVAHIRHPLRFHVFLNKIYHHIIFSMLLNYFNQSLIILKNKLLNKNKLNDVNSGIIWIFWWQGKHQMPLIVKSCIRSIVNHSNDHKVILLSKNNISKYVNLPKYICSKLYNGKITLTHFSDILRFNLLDKYGGLWIDSTMYCVSNLGPKYFKKFYTSGPGGKDINRYHDFISDKWTGFLIGGCSNNPIFSFMKIFFNLYWSKNNYLIDYFLIDYALYYIYLHNIGNFATYVNTIAICNNPHLHELQPCLNDKFNIHKYLDLIKGTDLFKLTYKMNFDNDCNTFYHMIINHELNQCSK